MSFCATGAAHCGRSFNLREMKGLRCKSQIKASDQAMRFMVTGIHWGCQVPLSGSGSMFLTLHWPSATQIDSATCWPIFPPKKLVICGFFCRLLTVYVRSNMGKHLFSEQEYGPRRCSLHTGLLVLQQLPRKGSNEMVQPVCRTRSSWKIWLANVEDLDNNA